MGGILSSADHLSIHPQKGVILAPTTPTARQSLQTTRVSLRRPASDNDGRRSLSALPVIDPDDADSPGGPASAEAAAAAEAADSSAPRTPEGDEPPYRLRHIAAADAEEESFEVAGSADSLGMLSGETWMRFHLRDRSKAVGAVARRGAWRVARGVLSRRGVLRCHGVMWSV